MTQINVTVAQREAVQLLGALDPATLAQHTSLGAQHLDDLSDRHGFWVGGHADGHKLTLGALVGFAVQRALPGQVLILDATGPRIAASPGCSPTAKATPFWSAWEWAVDQVDLAYGAGTVGRVLGRPGVPAMLEAMREAARNG